MSVKIATFNLENLFTRPSAMQSDHGSQAIKDHAEANSIIKKDIYTDDDKKKLILMSKIYGWHLLNTPKNALVTLQKIRGRLFQNSKKNGLSVVANGRSDWTGWFELRREDIAWEATMNTARVIHAHKPDILLLVEVENRPTFKRFNELVLKEHFGFSYPYFMVVDGNDERGIDVGIASRWPIIEIRSHVDDRDENGNTTFSRDCPEFDVMFEDGRRIVIIPNHFKSKRGGNDPAAIERRKRQAIRANAIARDALDRSPFVLIGGDLNDTPSSEAIVHVFNGGFADVSVHPDYPDDRPGTFGTGLAGNKLDYLVMSPTLQALLETTGIERRGSYHPNTWDAFPEVTGPENEASDHHLLWADFNL